jgi:hypothetical protein
LTLQIATPLKKLLAHGVNDILEVKPVVLSIPTDEHNMPDIEDIRFLLGVPWCPKWCTEQGLPISEHLFNPWPHSLDGGPQFPGVRGRCSWVYRWHLYRPFLTHRYTWVFRYT